MTSGSLPGISREQTRRIAAITREAEQLKRELRDLVHAQHPELLAETGCGPLSAAILRDRVQARCQPREIRSSASPPDPQLQKLTKSGRQSKPGKASMQTASSHDQAKRHRVWLNCSPLAKPRMVVGATR